MNPISKQKRQRVDEKEALFSQKRLRTDSDDDDLCLSTVSTPIRKHTPTSFDRSPSLVVSSTRPSTAVQVSSFDSIELSYVSLSPRPSIVVQGSHALTSDSIELPYVPLSCSRWPEQMYVINMKKGFTLVDSQAMKKCYTMLVDHVAAVFQSSVWKSGLRTGKRPEPNQTLTDQDRK